MPAVMHEVICCVYRIRSIVDNKIYVGCCVDYDLRKARHLRELEYQYHHNSHLQRAYNKYGKRNFKWRILEVCSPERRFEIEKAYIKKYASDDPARGYNKTYHNDTFRNFRGYYLTVEEVREIKVRIAKGELLRTIADDFDLRIQAISNIKTGRAWKDVQVSEEVVERLRRNFSTDQILKMFKLRLKGFTLSQIARKFDTTSSQVSRIINRQRYKDVEVSL